MIRKKVEAFTWKDENTSYPSQNGQRSWLVPAVYKVNPLSVC